MVVPSVILRYPLCFTHVEYADFRKLLMRTASSTVASGAVLSANSLLPSHSSHPEALWLDDTTQGILLAHFALEPFVIHKDQYVYTYVRAIL